MLSDFLQMQAVAESFGSVGVAIIRVPSSEVDDEWVEVGTAKASEINGVVSQVLIDLSPAFDSEMELENGGEPTAVAAEVRSLAESALLYVPSVMKAPLASAVHIGVRYGSAEVSFEFDTGAREIFESR